jgi:MFS family permease
MPIAPATSKSSASTATSQHKLWSVGTLTYTTGGLAVLFCWLLWGDLAWSLRERSVIFTVQLMLKKFEASDLLTGLLIGSLPSACSMILGPIISYRSDRHRGRWGRRIPFLLIPTPVIVLSMIGLAYSPALGHGLHHVLGGASPGLNFSILIFIGLFWLLFEMSINVAGQVIFYGLINDVVPQPLLGRFFGMFRVLSLLAAIIFNLWLLEKAESHYMWIFIGFGALYGVGFSMMCLKVKEGAYPPPVEDSGRAGGFYRAARLYIKECFGQPYYLWVFAAITMSNLMGTPVWVFGIFFAKSVQMDMGTYGKCLALTFLISIFLSYPLGALADRFHPLRVGIVTLALYLVVVLWGGVFARDAATFGIAIVAQGVASGSLGTGIASLGQRLYPRARFAQLASAQWIVAGIGNMLVMPMVGKFLDYTGHVYRYTLLISFGLGLISMGVFLILFRKFMALGGTKYYVAPE